MKITEPRIETVADGIELSAAFDGTRVQWTVPADTPVEARGEAFALAALMPSMRLGTPVILPPGWPVEAELLEHIAQLQVIWALWFPRLSAVPIEAEVAGRRVPTRRRATGYSGGVDSSYTVAAMRDDLDTLVFIDGIDAKRRDPALIAEILSGHGDVAQQLGLDFRVVRTDLKAFTNAQRISWRIYHGVGLGATAHALSAAHYTISASNSWENLYPLGSHPVTDPLASSASTIVTHFGADRHRIDKVRALGAAPLLLDRLRVCLEGDEYNCGHCDKCLQTAAELRAVGLRSASMKPLDDARMLRRTHVTSDGDLIDWVEILTPELEQRDPQLARELRRLVRRYYWRQTIGTADARLFGGAMKRLLRQLGLASPDHRPEG